MQTKTNVSPCPECGGTLELQADLRQGEIVGCDECGVELEVKTCTPLVLELAPEVEEDWGE